MNKQKLETIGNKIWSAVKTELLLSMRFLAPVLSAMEQELDLSTTTVGTDAEKILYNPEYIRKTYVEDPSKLNRTYMHILLHCLFRHMYRDYEFEDEEIWNVSCDIAVEHILDSMDVPCIYRVSSDLRDRWYERLTSDVEVLTAERIYRYLHGRLEWVCSEDDPTISEEDIIDEYAFNKLCREFCMDDHSFWARLQDNHGDDENQNKDNPDIDMQMQLRLRRANKKEREEFWKNEAKRMNSDLASIGDEKSSEAGSLSFYLRAEVTDKRSFVEFLQQIAVVREELRIDPDSFDYGLYQYGMELYGNMPLIEENEYSETHKVDELVIAIDTSASCSEELVQSFLNETAAILRNSDNFFRHFHVHIMECDNRLQKDIVLKHPEEIEKYAKHFEISGGYGTDFRPVFSKVDELRRRGELKNLRGLMYFTDGFGDYPTDPTPYDTAFVFPMDKQNGADNMPQWAIPLYISEDI